MAACVLVASQARAEHKLELIDPWGKSAVVGWRTETRWVFVGTGNESRPLLRTWIELPSGLKFEKTGSADSSFLLATEGDAGLDGSKGHVIALDGNAPVAKATIHYLDAEGNKQEIAGTKESLLPSWSPDGSKLAWIQRDGRKKFVLQVADVTR